MRKKFILVDIFIKAFDIFVISKPKLDCTFLFNQLLQDLNNLGEIEIALKVVRCCKLMQIFLVDL